MKQLRIDTFFKKKEVGSGSNSIQGATRDSVGTSTTYESGPNQEGGIEKEDGDKIEGKETVSKLEKWRRIHKDNRRGKGLEDEKLGSATVKKGKLKGKKSTKNGDRAEEKEGSTPK